METQRANPDFSLLNQVPLGVFVLDREGHFIFLNVISQRFFQGICHRAPAELLGRSIWDVCPEVADSTFSKEYGQALAERRIFELEVFYPTLNRWFLLRASPAEDLHYFYFNDITDHKRLEKQLHLRIDQVMAADRGKVEFLVQLAHQVRNTLAVLLNSFYMACQGGEAAQRAAVAGEKGIGYLSDLMNDLLKLSQLMLGQVQPRLERVDVAQIVARAAEAVIALPSARGRNFTIGLSPEPLWVDADPEQLREAVSYLLENAVQHTQPRDHIWLSAERQEGHIVVRVEDDGVGIAPEVLPRVFDLFMRGDGALKRTQTGLGTELTLVRSLVELQGGTVEATSEGQGKGSEFTVRLTPAPSGTPKQVEPSEAAGSEVQVMVVDNDVPAAESLALLVTGWGYKVHVVYDGPTTLREVINWRPQVVLLDIGMPGMDGYEVARLLRSQLGPRAPILIAVTGYTLEEDRRQAREAGFVCHLAKPVAPQKLQELLELVVGQARQDPSPL